ncbi:forkhead box protein N1 isoform X2 [Dunckerocampus dactyliophorus]|uniref:forkhead box protein N1 isoform X2 n=1 Tax=Dunckerocampus dactyliophorus TaxID=161453 RepID=UPI002406D482|nr:forkhead box protein N1 isoform X2 [Dunckerocampus dactyliophorus]
MSGSPSFSPRGECKTSTLQAKPHTCEPLGTSRQKVEESQIKDGGAVCFTLHTRTTSRTALVNRRHSVDGTLTSVSGQGLVDASRFHPYLRQFSEAAAANPVCLQNASSPFSGLLEVCSAQTCCTNSSSSDAATPWEQYNNSNQVASRLYTTEEHSNRPTHSFHSLPSHIHQRSPSQTLFPKPIYSYSILIFMALKNSKTGSLPVSQIYSFMTENFPYFKTAPDGWKNSVRHNLSLNKCFEKVESKNGSSSRKGCLWALNPTKVEKMQEELHKWRRKDPVTVRRSMARPEDLDRLLGERPNKLRSVPSYSRAIGVYGTNATSSSSTQEQPQSRPSRRPQYSQTYPPSQQLLSLHQPYGQQPTADQSHSTSSGKLPLAYSADPQADFSVGLRSLHELLLEGDASYDVDVLNPSLTDLQLQGNLWEELQEDSLASQPPTTPTSTTIPSVLQAPCVYPSCVDPILPYC